MDSKQFDAKNNGKLSIEHIKNSIEVEKIQQYFKKSVSELEREIITICEIASPTFYEDRRAQYLKNKLESLNLKTQIDEYKNVISVYPGNNPVAKLAICSHIDTVFNLQSIKVSHTKGMLLAPGIGDNSTSVAAMLSIIKAWRVVNYIPPFNVIFIGNSCEEGLGDLKGIKGFLDGYANNKNVSLECIVVIDGTLSFVTHIGIGVRRLKVEIKTKGGHSWANFGVKSAIHVIGTCIAEISKINLDPEPRTTFNIGLIEGGTSVNTIAEQASMVIDLRSVNLKNLQKLEEKVRRIIKKCVKSSEILLNIEIVGNRPIGSIPKSHPLVQIALNCGNLYGINIKFSSASTDANIPLSRNIPSITVGCYEGMGAHTLAEYIDLKSLEIGLPYLNLTLLSVIAWIKDKI